MLSQDQRSLLKKVTSVPLIPHETATAVRLKPKSSKSYNRLLKFTTGPENNQNFTSVPTKAVCS